MLNNLLTVQKVHTMLNVSNLGKVLQYHFEIME